ncbi:MAG TPA: helix-turn-helix domain-containing protein, partial [bacterium]|nr:helix-turn-helix domain-containing protein [bacterium]
VRMLRENARGAGRGKTLRQLSRETGIAPSVLSRGERGLQDLRQAEYIERLAPFLGVRASVLRRVASVITGADVERMRPQRTEEETAGLPARSAQTVLWAKLVGELEGLRSAPVETLEALLAYIEFLASRSRKS